MTDACPTCRVLRKRIADLERRLRCIRVYAKVKPMGRERAKRAGTAAMVNAVQDGPAANAKAASRAEQAARECEPE